MSFDELPPEIVVMIFSNLPQKDLYSVAQVSKRMRSLAFDSTLWKEIDLHGSYQTKDAMKKILKRCNLFAQKITFSMVTDFSWIKRLPKCENVDELEFINCEFDIRTAKRFVKRFPLISLLEIEECDVNSYTLRRFVRWKYLKSISLTESRGDDYTNYDYWDDDKCVILIAKKCENLEQLYLHGNFIIGDEAFLVLHKLRSLQLTHLAMSGSGLSSDSYHVIPSFHRLKNLYLYDISNITEEDYQLVKSLKYLDELELDLINN